MKKVSIIYNQPLSLVQGINYVNSSFVEGNHYFNDKCLELANIYSPNEKFQCVGKNTIELIGANIGSSSYRRERTIRLFLKKILNSDYIAGALVKMYFNHLRNAKLAVRRYLRDKHKSDYLIFQDLFSVLFFYRECPRPKEKTILIIHSGDHELEQFEPSFMGVFKYKKLGNLVRNKCHEALLKVDKVVYLSNYACNNSPLPIEKKTFIFNGKSDLESYTLTPVSEPINIVVVGSVIFRKGQHIVIEALSKLPFNYLNRIKLNIVGAGDELTYCMELAKKMGVSDYVYFWGNRNDVSEILKKMDVMVLASDSEGMPMSIIEGLRQGLYIIGTNVAGVPEMITEKFGRIVDRTPESISKTIKEVIDLNLVSVETKKAARDFYLENFTLKKMIYSYSSVLKNI